MRSKSLELMLRIKDYIESYDFHGLCQSESRKAPV